MGAGGGLDPRRQRVAVVGGAAQRLGLGADGGGGLGVVLDDQDAVHAALIQNTTTSGSSTFAPPTGRAFRRVPGVKPDMAGRAAGGFEKKKRGAVRVIGGRSCAAPLIDRMRSPLASPARSAGEVSVRAVTVPCGVQRHAKGGERVGR
jgi:hypothetical protein